MPSHFDTRQKWIIFSIVYGIFATVAVFALLAAAGIGKFDPSFTTWSTKILLVDICGAALMGFSQTFLNRKIKLRVNFSFAGIKIASSIKLEKCVYEITDEDSKLLQSGEAVALFGAGGWFCEIGVDSPNAEFAKITLIDASGNSWAVRTFGIRNVFVEAEK